ncbi:hypothetical protein SRHO_G00171590 [Serrasalmus rhombeus]
MPSSLQAATGKERRPSPTDHCQMIRIIVDELRKSEAYPTRKMEQAFEERGRLIIDFFKTKPTNDAKKVLGTHAEEEVAALFIELLMAHFKEKTEDIIFQTEETASAANIERTLDLAESPQLIILGMADSLSSKDMLRSY